MKPLAIFLPVITWLCAMQYAAAQTTHMRLIAVKQSRYNGTQFINYDSARYVYSGTHEGNLDIYPVVLDYDKGNTYTWDSTDHWLQTNRYTNLFDANERMVQTTNEVWNTTTNHWDSSDRGMYTYNAQGQQTEYLVQDWNGGTWDNSFKQTITYTAAGMSQQLNQFWNSSNNTWFDNDRFVYSYDANNKLAEELHQFWNSTWQNVNRTRYSYNGTGLLQTASFHVWNISANTWDSSTRSTITYDAANDPATTLYEEWDGSAYVYLQKQTTTFSNHQRTLAETQSWSSASTGWVYTASSYRMYYFYEPFFPAAIDKLPLQAGITLYPMPANDVLHIALENSNGKIYTLTLTDMNGRKLLQQQGHVYNNMLSLPVANLPAGSYLLSVATNGQSTTRQVSIVH